MPKTLQIVILLVLTFVFIFLITHFFATERFDKWASKVARWVWDNGVTAYAFAKVTEGVSSFEKVILIIFLSPIWLMTLFVDVFIIVLVIFIPFYFSVVVYFMAMCFFSQEKNPHKNR